MRRARTCRTTTTARLLPPKVEGGGRSVALSGQEHMRGPAGAVAAQVAVGRRGDGIAAVEQSGGEAGELLGQRGGVG